jgi:FemAB-related protein (PEP-CTERM system-associated)
VVGVFPIVWLKSLMFGSIACSMPFVNYGGPCGETDEIEQELMRAGQAVVDDWGVDYLEIRGRRKLEGAYPCSEHKVSMTIELAPDPETLFANFKTGQRRELNRAFNKGFVTRHGPELLDDFYAVLSDSWRDLGTPIYRADYLKAVIGAFPDATRVTVVYAADGRPAAGAIDGVHNGTVEGMWLGMRGEYRQQLVGYVLYWELIKHACESGYTSFHLGRSSKDSGGEQFKKKWNADTMQLYWQYVLRKRSEIPSLNPTNSKYQLAIQAWRKLPVSITQFVGPYLAKSIP